ncbi:MAG: hypothetical protein KAT58_00165, partial [candidate division Zixibacteria bacterium]|nr:hypothetical protein [candidate division Zixibacteria bacterium]
SGNDWAVLKQVLNGCEGRAQLFREPVDEVLAGFKVYDITNYIPQLVKERLGKDRDVPGPNCYQAALAALGFADLEGRHVDPLEAGYHFTCDFEEIDEVRNDPALGDIRIYHERHRLPASAVGFAAAEEPEPALIDIMEDAHDIPPAIGASCVHMFNLEEAPEWVGTILDIVPDISDENLKAVTAITPFASTAEAEMLEPRAELEALEAEEVEAPVMLPEFVTQIKPGVHAALVLLGGLVFQRGGWDEDHVNMIVPAAQAMSAIEAIIRDKFYPPEKANDEDFASKAIRKLSPEELALREDERVIDEELSAEIAAYAPLIEHYTGRLLAVSCFQWSEFANNRVDLLTMENIWSILSDIEKKLGKQGDGMIRVLQSIDENVAKAYLKLRSLRWQYQAMVNRYDSPGRADSSAKKKRRQKKLYQEYYIHPGSKAFRNEIKAHLVVRAVAPKKRAGIIKLVIAQLKKVDPVRLVKGYGADQINFFEILNQAIEEA